MNENKKSLYNFCFDLSTLSTGSGSGETKWFSLTITCFKACCRTSEIAQMVIVCKDGERIEMVWSGKSARRRSIHKIAS